jgi:membrane complex biogenesis BtpA family protein
MVHVGALPGTPLTSDPLAAIIERAVADAVIYRDEGCTAIGLENMHDRPYLKGAVGPEIVAAMTAVACEVKRAAGLPLGIQILAGANREALAVAHAAGADFVRVEGFVFAHVADEGLIEGCAGELLRYRRAIGADNVLIFADVKKKHAAHAITSDVSLAETARAAEFFLADGVIVTGSSTGVEASAEDVQGVVDTVNVPVLVGSGLTPDNLHRFRAAHGFIVGSSLKEGGQWDRPVDRDAVRRMVRACKALSDVP